ncbi:sodium:calcium antiporter [bacterium]|nr:sodium:calcium antiporter [bacterium]
MFIEILLLCCGVGILLSGADALIKGATNIAARLGVSTLIIGLTVVAFGTSAPELFVSVAAAIEGTADIAVGNVVGSNIFNILVVIGLTALIAPVDVARSIVHKDYPIMLIALGIFFIVSIDGVISRADGAILVFGFISYLFMNYLEVTSSERAVIEEFQEEELEQKPEAKTKSALLLILVGLIGLIIGAELIVENAVSIARKVGVSELVIGVTLVALGTSLPELATTVLAARRGEPDLVVGNAVGSNIFNVLCVISFTALIQPLPVVRNAISFDMPYMWISCGIILPMLFLKRTIGRHLGLMMLIGYGVYIMLCLG